MERHLGVLLGLLWAQVCWVRGLNVEQSPSALSLQEGTSSSLRCTFSTTALSVQWFRQNPRGGLISLFYLGSGTKHNGRLSATLHSKDLYSTLNITASQLEDSATYLCAAEGDSGYNTLTFGKGTMLLVSADIKNPDPAVYQLRSPKYSNTSVCLFTDFDSKINVSQEPSSTVFSSNSMALDMRAVGPKSNGALRWSASTDFLCENAFKETFYSSSGIPCDATLIEKSFETDMSLNIQNLSVIGLRILLLKVAGFNLLMTLRLWSS